jgi:hydrogenase-4 component H
MFKLLKEVFRTGTATVRYPFAPLPVSPHFRGKPEFDPERCIACAACTIACPPNALAMETDPQAGTRIWSICFGRCIFCGRCEEVCPTGAIALSPQFEMAVTSRADLYQTAVFRLADCRVCGTPFAPAKEIDYVLALLLHSGLPAEAAERQRAILQTCPSCKRAADVPKVSGIGFGQKMEATR